MVGLLGCGCCGCCTEPTSKWTADFSVTPTVGSVWDEVTEIGGAGTRSYAPVGQTGNSSKISRLTIDADPNSPLYQGFNSSPKGVKFVATWAGKPGSDWPIESLAFWKAPTAQSGQRHIMRLEVYTELIYNVGDDELRTGIYTKWQKNFDGTYSGITRETYDVEMYGYLQVNGGSRTIQGRYENNGIFYGSTLNGPRPTFYAEHLTDRLGSFDDDCQKIYEAKFGRTEILKGDNLLDDRLAVGQQPTPTSVDDQKFDCLVGWNSEVHWTTIRGSGLGVPVGTFNFNGYFMRWQTASWQ